MQKRAEKPSWAMRLYYGITAPLGTFLIGLIYFPKYTTLTFFLACAWAVFAVYGSARRSEKSLSKWCILQTVAWVLGLIAVVMEAKMDPAALPRWKESASQIAGCINWIGNGFVRLTSGISDAVILILGILAFLAFVIAKALPYITAMVVASQAGENFDVMDTEMPADVAEKTGSVGREEDDHNPREMKQESHSDKDSSKKSRFEDKELDRKIFWSMIARIVSGWNDIGGGWTTWFVVLAVSGTISFGIVMACAAEGAFPIGCIAFIAFTAILFAVRYLAPPVIFIKCAKIGAPLNKDELEELMEEAKARSK